MSRDNSPRRREHHEHPLPQEISDQQRKINESAREEATQDMEEDADVNRNDPNADLDEGELGRLGEENTGLV